MTQTAARRKESVQQSAEAAQTAIAVKIMGSMNYASLLTNVGNRMDYVSSPLSGSVLTAADMICVAATGVLVAECKIDPASSIVAVGSLICGSYRMLDAIYPAGLVYGTIISAVQSVAFWPPAAGVPFISGLAPTLGVPVVRTLGHDPTVVAVGIAKPPSPPAAATVTGVAAAMVTEIRGALSLNISELARIIGVERATIYAWIKGKTALPREQDKQDRLRAVYAVAQKWSALRRGSMGAWRHLPIMGERTLVDLLQGLGGVGAQPPRTISSALELIREKQEGARSLRDASLTAVRTKSARRRDVSGDEGAGKNVAESEADGLDRVIDHLDWFVD